MKGSCQHYPKQYISFLTSSFFSRIGEWMDFTVLNWIVLEATKSPFALGILNACRLIPIFLFSIPGGILADRFSKKKILKCTQLFLAFMTFILLFVWNAELSFGWIAVIIFIRSVFLAIETPVRNALIANLVKKNQLAGAISLHTSIIHISRLLGPALSGWLLTIFHENVLFTTYIILLIISFMTLLYLPEDKPARTVKKKNKGSMIEVVLFIKKDRPLKALLLLSVVPMLFGFPYSSMLPIFVNKLINLGPEQFGFMLSLSSIGALMATILMSTGKIQVTVTKMIGTCLLFGTLLIGYIISYSFIWIVWGLLFLIGFFSQFYRTSSRILLQHYVPNEIRGRVLSIFLMDRGFISLGVLLFSFIAEWNVYWSGVLMGMLCVTLSALIILWNYRCLQELSKGDHDENKGKNFDRGFDRQMEKLS